MLENYTCLEKLANQRSDEIVVTTMSVAMPWATHSDGPLDFAHVESAMGHAADFALGLAIAQPNRRVLCINGDGSTLMSLGVLVTLAQRPARRASSRPPHPAKGGSWSRRLRRRPTGPARAPGSRCPTGRSLPPWPRASASDCWGQTGRASPRC